MRQFIARYGDTVGGAMRLGEDGEWTDERESTSAPDECSVHWPTKWWNCTVCMPNSLTDILQTRMSQEQAVASAQDIVDALTKQGLRVVKAPTKQLKVSIKIQSLLDSGAWEEVCDAIGINYWAVNEGQISVECSIDIPLELAAKYGLLTIQADNQTGEYNEEATPGNGNH